MSQTASLVFFYFGEESYLNALAQETVQISKAFEGYDHTVLLKFPEINLGPFNLSAKAERGANVSSLPTRENFVEQLNNLGLQGYATDLYIFSHGWNNSFRVSTGNYGDNSKITANYIKENVKPLDLRMVWQCNCYGSTLNSTWQELGAQATGGSRFINFYPTRFNRFIESWNSGETFHHSLSAGDIPSIRTPVQTYIMADAFQSRKDWGGCSFGETILGNGECAESYFKYRWLGDNWSPAKSGRQNMNYSSEMLIAGNPQLRKISK